MLEFENYAHVTHMKGREMRAPSPQTRATSAGCHTRVKTRLALEDAGEAWTRFVTGGGVGEAKLQLAYLSVQTKHF